MESTLRVVDFFCGCGGTSAGLRNAGMEIILGIDSNHSVRETFEYNFPNSAFFCEDIRNVNVDDISEIIERNNALPLVFSCCAPCQPFSSQRTEKAVEDQRVNLISEFARFVERYNPDYIFVENVPGIRRPINGLEPFLELTTRLTELGYSHRVDVVLAKSYGVPQRRRRLVLLATRHGEIAFPNPTHGNSEGLLAYSTVADWIRQFPAISAGETHPTVPNHQSARLSPLNLRRIMATPQGGGRLDWDRELQLECHNGNYTGHTDVYGRMSWDFPASGLTTRCISLSNGRFGHPEQNRAISVREAASLQTFPIEFIFKGTVNSMARQIGNAVPVRLAQEFGQSIMDHNTRIRENG